MDKPNPFIIGTFLACGEHYYKVHKIDDGYVILLMLNNSRPPEYITVSAKYIYENYTVVGN